MTVECALRNIAPPIGVAAFRVTDALPADLVGSLLTVQQIESALAPLDEQIQVTE